MLSRAEVRDIDRRASEEFGLPTLLLMENAGRGTADLLRRQGITGPVVICAGKGNNGGDGFVIARHLDAAGATVRVLLFAPANQLAGDALLNYNVVRAAGIPVMVLEMPHAAAQLQQELAAAEWIVDALLGTGLQGAVREPYASTITAINAAGKRVLAIDLPSGLDCDTGQPLGPCIRAERTATFVARKLGFDALGADAFTGEVHCLEIGVPRLCLPPSMQPADRT